MARRRTLLAATIVVTACACWFMLSRQDGPAPGSGELLAQAPAIMPEERHDASIAVAPVIETRTVAETTAPTVGSPLAVPTELSHPYLYVLRVRTLDAHGLPVEHAPLRVAPARCSLNMVAPFSEQGGLTTLVWWGKAAEMEFDVQYGHSSTMEGARRLRLRAGIVCETALIGPASANGSQLVRIHTGGSSSLRGFTPSSSRGQANERLTEDRSPPQHARFLDRFVGGQLQPSEPMREIPRARASDADIAMRIRAETVALEPTRISLGKVRFINGSPYPPGSDPGAAFSEVGVLVLDDQGEPVANTLVAMGEKLDAPNHREFTDESGRAVLRLVRSGWKELRAGGGPGGLARERLFVQAPTAAHWTAQLARGSRVIGRVVDPEGKPVPNVLVRYESTPDVVSRGTVHRNVNHPVGNAFPSLDDLPEQTPGELSTPWIDEVPTTEDGHFELANLPPSLGRLSVGPWGDPGRLPWVVEEGVIPGDHEYLLRLPAALGWMRIGIDLPPGHESEELELRAFFESTAHGMAFARVGDSYSCEGLGPGWYRVELGAGCLGWHDLGRHYLDEGAQVDLGKFAPPLPGRVHVAVPEGQRRPLDLTFYLRRDDIDVRSEPRALDRDMDLSLPAGEYWASWHRADGVSEHRRLRVNAGETMDLDLR